jgi:mono/diheme cytochrome c family protein
MHLRIIILAGVLFAGLCACGSGAKENGPVVGQQEKTIDGKAIYENRCVSCHGKDGTRGVSGAKDLSVSAMTVEDRILLITNGKNTMPGYSGALSEKEIRAVAEYTVTLKK